MVKKSLRMPNNHPSLLPNSLQLPTTGIIESYTSLRNTNKILNGMQVSFYDQSFKIEVNSLVPVFTHIPPFIIPRMELDCYFNSMQYSPIEIWSWMQTVIWNRSCTDLFAFQSVRMPKKPLLPTQTMLILMIPIPSVTDIQSHIFRKFMRE